jgi:hypothetical protein
MLAAGPCHLAPDDHHCNLDETRGLGRVVIPTRQAARGPGWSHIFGRAAKQTCEPSSPRTPGQTREHAIKETADANR